MAEKDGAAPSVVGRPKPDSDGNCAACFYAGDAGECYLPRDMECYCSPKEEANDE